ncbi:cytochrome P450 2U1-like [Antedon mediterranea]|uniref:cytochrome P450 2U1-like n=1 Tax=Antedon mediterranea TaxID=105859 RepID=UPI003AF7CD15
MSLNTGSIVWENGPAWKARRRWIISALRHFGMGKRSMEVQINREATTFCQEAAEYKSKPFDPEHIVNCAVTNIICSIAFGRRYEYQDPEFVELLKNLLAFFRQCNIKSIEMHLPFIMSFPMFKYKTLSAKHIVEFTKKQVKQHVETFDLENIRDVTDRLLAERETCSDDEKAFFDPDVMCSSITTIFLAGAETTSSTLKWFILFMAAYQNVQAKVHEEIDRVLEGRSPTMTDRQLLPYLEATTYEVQRLGNVLGTTIPHGTAEECTIKGYKIPKGTTILLNLYRIHRDPKYWDDPLLFNPLRFFKEDSQTVHKPESFMPFGIGRRACLGENLAKMEIFIFMVNFFQKFKVEIPAGHPQPDVEPEIGLTFSPKPFQVCVNARG